MATAVTVFYYDQRVRKEGFDIEWMMRKAGLNLPAEAAQPALSFNAVPSVVAIAADSLEEQ